MTERIDKQKHRQQGRGRKAFWVILTLGVVLILIAAARSPRRERGESHHGFARHGELSAEGIEEFLAADGWWLEKAGIEEAQRQQIAALLEESLPRIEALAAERDLLFQGLTEVLELGNRAVGESFDLVLALAEVLTHEQRQELIQHWSGRR
jgi:Spy/CpxP family protein refolding chaperone